MVHQHFTLVPSQTVTENILLGLDTPRFRLRPAPLRSRGRAAGRPVRAAGRPAGQDLAAVGRRAAAGRDPQDALPRRADPDHGRADRRPRPPGGRRAVRDAALDDRRRPQRRVHQPQARRGARRSPTGSRSCAAARSRPPALSPTGATTKADLARRMVGRTVLETVQRTPQRAGRVVSSRSGTSTADNDRGLPALRGVSLDVARRRDRRHRRGRRQRPERAGPGHHRPAAVRRQRDGRRRGGREPDRPAMPSATASPTCPRTGPASGSSPEPVDRRQPDHEALPRRAGRARLVHRRHRGARRSPRASATSYAIAAPSIDTQARLLSGGNLQRLILAREIEAGPKLMVAVQPTRGLDVGAIEAVHRVLLARRESGTAILLISRGPRRDPRPGRPGRRHVRGPGRRLVRRRERRHPGDRVADDRRRGGGREPGEAAAATAAGAGTNT